MECKYMFLVASAKKDNNLSSTIMECKFIWKRDCFSLQLLFK